VLPPGSSDIAFFRDWMCGCKEPPGIRFIAQAVPFTFTIRSGDFMLQDRRQACRARRQ